MAEINDDDGISSHYTQPFVNLPYTPKNWYLSVFKNFPQNYPRGFYNVSIRPLLNMKEAVQLYQEEHRRVTVSQPTILSPIDMTPVISNRNSILIVGSEFSTTYPEVFDTLKVATFRIGSLVKTSNSTRCEFSSDELSALEDGEYKVQIKYEGNELGISKWSPEITLILKSGYVIKPFVVIPALNDVVNIISGKFTVQGSTFETGYAMDIHEKTRWKVCLDPNGKDDRILNEEDVISLTSHTFENVTELENNKTYYIFVKYYGVKFGQSEWSDGVPFTVKKAVVERPIIISPANGDKLINDKRGIIVTTSEFKPSIGEDTHLKTLYCIFDSDDNVIFEKEVDADTNYTISTTNLNLEQKSYYIKVKYLGEVLGWSDFSEPCKFTVVTPNIKQPTLLPSTQELILHNPIIVSTSNFATTEGNDTHASTDWIVCFNNDIKTVVVSDIVSHDLTTHSFSTDYDYIVGQPYYVFARHRGVNFGVSEWSNSGLVSFIRGHILAPEIKLPCTLKYEEDGSKTLKVTTSEFMVSDNDQDVHDKTLFKICSDIEGKNEIVSYTELSSRLIHIFSNEDLYELVDGENTYYLFVQHHGKELGWGAYSEPFAIVTREIPEEIVIEPPEILDCTLHVTESGKTLTIQTGEFTVSNGSSDTHIQTIFRVCSDPDGVDIITSYTANYGEVLDSYTFSNEELSDVTLGNNYYVFVAYVGEELGISGFNYTMPNVVVD